MSYNLTETCTLDDYLRDAGPTVFLCVWDFPNREDQIGTPIKTESVGDILANLGLNGCKTLKLTCDVGPFCEDSLLLVVESLKEDFVVSDTWNIARIDGVERFFRIVITPSETMVKFAEGDEANLFYIRRYPCQRIKGYIVKF